MNENDFLFMEVSFNHYYNNSGKKIDVSGSKITGEFFGYSTQQTEDGLQIVGVVRTTNKQICFVPTHELFLSGNKKIIH